MNVEVESWLLLSLYPFQLLRRMMYVRAGWASHPTQGKTEPYPKPLTMRPQHPLTQPLLPAKVMRRWENSSSTEPRRSTLCPEPDSHWPSCFSIFSIGFCTKSYATRMCTRYRLNMVCCTLGNTVVTHQSCINELWCPVPAMIYAKLWKWLWKTVISRTSGYFQ